MNDDNVGQLKNGGGASLEATSYAWSSLAKKNYGKKKRQKLEITQIDEIRNKTTKIQ